MTSKTVEILLGTPLEGLPGGLPSLPTFATPPPETVSGEAAEVSARRTPWRVVQCPSCQALSYLSDMDALPGWTTCPQCGQAFRMD